MKKIPYIPLAAAILACSATAALGSAKVSVSSDGKGVFTVRGAEFSGVAGAKITLSYDAATLANPRVAQGGLVSAALMASNTATPGTVTLAVIQGGSKGVSGNGDLATITFDLRGHSPGAIQSQTVDLVGPTGARIAAASEITNPVEQAPSTSTSETNPPTAPSTTAAGTPPPVQEGNSQGVQVASLAQPNQATQNSGSAASATTAAARVVGGGLVLPEEPPLAKGGEEKPQEQQLADAAAPRKEGADPATTGGEAPRAPREVVAKVAESDPAVKATPLTHPGVLERFRSYQGPQTPTALVALFDAPAQGIRQEPPVILSDGGARVKIFVPLASAGKSAPSFALQNATVISVSKDGAANWVVEALPTKDASSAALIMLHDGAMTEIPLTVAPPLGKEALLGKGELLSEGDFNRFLSERGTRESPMFDLNRDGVRDYVDDFIFTANYIVAAQRGQKVNAKEPK